MVNLGSLIDAFFTLVARGAIDIYNEFSLQHELGVHLRSLLSPKHKVQFERPVSFFDIKPPPAIKKEIDISLFLPDQTEKIAIELKFPRNGQYPEQIFAACQDIAFLEELIHGGFTAGHFVIAVDDPLFYRGGSQEGIYAYFRAGRPIAGVIEKPTGARDKSVRLAGQHILSWREAGGVRYARVAVIRSR